MSALLSNIYMTPFDVSMMKFMPFFAEPYGINAISNNVPLNVLQKWLGHAQLSTTAIYANAGGKEEDALAAQMWDS